MQRLHKLFTTTLILFLGGCGADSGTGTQSGQPPYEAEDALATFEVEDGFRVELVAAEPLVADPVAMEIDEYGRLYVVEMPGYPLDVSGSGKVKLLTDGNGDGKPDQSTVFADGLTLPTGVMRWKNGILVTDPPDVLYFEDTDDDGRADVREVILTGFSLSNPQHNFNSPIFGLDNWIYLANEGSVRTDRFEELSDLGSEIRFPGRDTPKLGRNGFDRNVRFRPDTYEIETMSGRTQYGHTFDAWGHHFLVDNWRPQRHEVIAARYLLRNPALPVRQSTQYTPAYGYGGAVYPITENPEHQLLTDRGVFTSATGITYYQGELFPSAYDNVTFVAEPVHNLIHVDKVTPTGATFSADRLIENREFLASTDAWFRPVNFYNGPDGAIYMVDYYRQIIEHPEWMDDELEFSPDLQNGTEQGRIYRIVPDNAPALSWSNNLTVGDATDTELVQMLESRNIWHRRTAQRLLMDRKSDEAVEPLLQMASESTSAVGRLHALWTLEGYGRLTSDLIRQALQDPEAGVRENAIILAELHFNADPDLAQALIPLENDPNARVRFQLLCTLGGLDSGPARAVRQRLLFRDIEDEWVQVAALSVSPDQGRPSFDAALTRFGNEASEGRTTYLSRIATLIGAGGAVNEIQGVIRRAARSSEPAAAWWRTAGLEGLAAGMQGTSLDPSELQAEQTLLLESFFDQSDASVRSAYLGLLRVLDLTDSLPEAVQNRAVALTGNADTDADLRADAIRLLGLDDANAHEDTFRQVIDPTEPPVVQKAALAALRQTDGPESGQFVLDRWTTFTPDLHEAALDVFMTEEARVKILLDAIEAEEVPDNVIAWQRRVELMRDWEGDVRNKARELLSIKPEARAAVVEEYLAALDVEGNIENGEAVFSRVCSTCHQVSGTGGAAFGPDLATVRHWSEQDLVSKILNPARSLADGYELWTIERRSGESVSGIIAGETPTSITLHLAGGAEQTIPRSDIVALQSADVSAMPAGLEAQIDKQQMANLVRYLREGQ